MKRLFIFFLFLPDLLLAQQPDHIYMSNIKSVKLHMYGNPLATPVWPLNSNDRMELHFDDLDANVKNYSYTYELRNADWSPVMLTNFDYIQGFSQSRLTTYRMSSVALTRYTHYQVVLPERNSVPTRPGNYLLKVFADGDPSKVVFTRRFLVTEQRVEVGAQIQQPFNGQYFRSHQKVQFAVNTSRLNLVNAMQQVRVVILQNDRWDNAITDIRPTFIRQGSLEYNTENTIFPGGREWRWLDLRSFRLQSDRVEKADYQKNATAIFVRPDVSRADQRFVFYRDNNGKFYPELLESLNPYWQGDYAKVQFSFVPPGNRVIPGLDVFLFGELTNYGDHENAKMTYNADTGLYETSVLLKQGYYDYYYVTSEKGKGVFEISQTEGNYWETENTYTILVYYKPLGGRADELIGYTKINSLGARQGLGF
jgi:hypothetical protein